MRVLGSYLSPRRSAGRDEAGITLPELVVTVLIFSIVATMLAVQFESWARNSTIVQDRSEAMGQGRLAMAQMTRSLRQAGDYRPGSRTFLEAGPFSVTFVEVTSTSLASSRSVVATYTLTNRVILESRTLSPTGTPLVTNRQVASFVSNPTGPPATPLFRYYSIGDTELASSIAGLNLTTAELDQIGVVRLTLVMDKDPSSPVGQTIFTDAVYVRSKGFE